MCCWGGIVAQTVKHLPSKCETLSSNSSTAKKKKRFFQYVLCVRNSFQIYQRLNGKTYNMKTTQKKT
jgi:hypothetical protein